MFENNFVKMNSDKCNLISCIKAEEVWAQIGKHKLWETVKAATGGVLWKKEFLKTLQISQKTLESLFKKATGLNLAMVLSSKICETFKNFYSEAHAQTTASKIQTVKLF